MITTHNLKWFYKHTEITSYFLCIRTTHFGNEQVCLGHSITFFCLHSPQTKIWYTFNYYNRTRTTSNRAVPSVPARLLMPNVEAASQAERTTLFEANRHSEGIALGSDGTSAASVVRNLGLKCQNETTSSRG